MTHYFYAKEFTLSELSFSTLQLKPELIQNLDSMGYQQMTDIQAQSLPTIISGGDVIAQGKTGSGKTAAFGLGVLEKLEVKRFRIQSLILCPTRELADQVAKELRKLARAIHNIKILTLCGGMPFGPQVGSLEHGAHIIVGTPGRIEDHLGKGTLKLDDVNMLVLDEADRMLEMGFQASVDFIISNIPQDRQTLLFSATFPPEIADISKKIMRSPTKVTVEGNHEESTISQHFYKVENDSERIDGIRLLLLKHQPESSIVFCNTKKDVQIVVSELRNYGFNVQDLHGDLEQRDRTEVLVRFSNKSISILVATDVAARGLDVDALDAVFNYHIARDSEIHVHRIGRTGRAGSTGIACSFFSEKESYKIGLLEDYLDRTIEGELLPDASVLNESVYSPKMSTIQIDGGKKQKVRAGDILGALTGDKTISGSEVGKIQLSDNWAYVAVSRKFAKLAYKKLSDGKLKGRKFRVRLL